MKKEKEETQEQGSQTERKAKKKWSKIQKGAKH
jgi:hypothetical protein